MARVFRSPSKSKTYKEEYGDKRGEEIAELTEKLRAEFGLSAPESVIQGFQPLITILTFTVYVCTLKTKGKKDLRPGQVFVSQNFLCFKFQSKDQVPLQLPPEADPFNRVFFSQFVGP